VIFLSGLTCTEENVTVKAGAQRIAAALGLVFIAPDTSPRGKDVPDADAYDLGQGAGFYVDATRAPWSTHFRMESYIAHEFHDLVIGALALDPSRIGLTGHSMGGHGALTLALKHPGRYRSLSAFSPIVAPSQVPWGRKAFTAYLGPEEAEWRRHDACALIATRTFPGPILIDQGDADGFLKEQLQTWRFEEACKASGQQATVRMQPGYDHSYFFIATFIEDHLRHHARELG
jgi:S-formylglutathione hydrolase